VQNIYTSSVTPFLLLRRSGDTAAAVLHIHFGCGRRPRWVIDGKEHFVPAAGVVRFMSAGVNFNKQIPELIVVAIPSIRTGPVI